ncbi:MAG: HDOD domain-containing protein [Phycisphaeraceae bacterium]|nr:HDOD domain-containing protein [Phycisphaeraceae bacterium]
MTPTTANPSTAAPGNDQDKIVKDAIQEISHIATLPEVTLKIIRLVEDADSTAQDLNKVITNDPALGARILKVVNSAFYGLPGQIGSLNRAIVLLGLNAVKNIAIAASLAKLFRGGQISPHFNARDLWTHSIAVGAATRMLAEKIGLGLPDEAFLAGLIHDLGIMVEMQARRPKFVEVIEKLQLEPALPQRQVETEIIGANHEQFGAGLCSTWKFPINFVQVTGYHHRPMEVAQNSRMLTALVHVADILVAQPPLGYVRDVEISEVNPDVLKLLNLTPARLAEVVEKVPAATEEAKNLLTDA